MKENGRKSFIEMLRKKTKLNPNNMTTQQMIDFYDEIDKETREELGKSIYENDFDERYN